MPRRGFRAYDGTHARKPPFEINFNAAIARNLAVAIPFLPHFDLRDIGPSQFPVLNRATANSDFAADPLLNSQRYDWPNANNDHFELDTGDNGILATEVNSAFMIWMSGATSGNRDSSGNAAYSERTSGGTPIWKYTTHNQTGGDPVRPVFVHRDDASSITVALNGVSDVEAGDLHLIGFTKEGTTIRHFFDGLFAEQDTLNGTDTLATADPVIGWDSLDSTGASRLRHPLHHLWGWKRTLSDAECWTLYNPSTRWDIYQQVTRRTYFFVAAAAAIPTIHLTMPPYIPAGK